MKDIYVHQNEGETFDLTVRGETFVQTATLTRDELDTLKEQIVKADDDSFIIE